MATTEGLHPTLMRPRVESLLADPEAKALGLYLVSGFRSVELQAKLYAEAVAKYGPAEAGKWVASPGKSNHGPKRDGFGIAVDLGIPGLPAVKGQWPPATEAKVNALAAHHGLYSPLSWEDWHFEPIEGWAPPMAQGIDVSNHQRDVDWYAVHQSGVSFAFAKTTEGKSYVDPWFGKNRAGARRVGIRFGAYHFARPSSNGAIVEADFFLRALGDRGGDMVCLDIEDEKAQGSCADWILAWMNKVERATGTVPYLYTYKPWWLAHGSPDPAFARYPLWLAAYQQTEPTPPKPWREWAIWQYSSSGTQAGVVGRCDMNRGRFGAPTSAPTVTPREELLMPVGLNDQDARRAWCRLQCLTFWGNEPTAEELDWLAGVLAVSGADNVLAGIADHPKAAELRTKRGW